MIRSCPAVYFPLSARRARFSAACLIPPPASSLITRPFSTILPLWWQQPLRSGSVNAIRPVSLLCLPGGGSKRGQYGNPPPAATRATDINRPSSPAFRAFSASAFAVSDSDSSDDSEASLIPRSSSFSRVSRLSGPPNESLICPPAAA